jgi:hypothetical protein
LARYNPLKELSLIYSEHVRSAFEVYDSKSKELLGHITFSLKGDKPGEYCFTPVSQAIGKANTTIIGALRDYFKSEVRLHFPVEIS